jgi:hypothetical protein
VCVCVCADRQAGREGERGTKKIERERE